MENGSMDAAPDCKRVLICGVMDFKSAMWSRLPFNIVERVLSFLPVPDLCRYRTVCKKWNQLIRTSEFGATCATNASKRDASFIIIRSYRMDERSEGSEGLEGSEGPEEDPDSPEPPPRPTHTGWYILDVKAWLGYTIDDAQYDRPDLFPGIVDIDS